MPRFTVAITFYDHSDSLHFILRLLAPDTRLQNDPMICIEFGICKKERERIDFDCTSIGRLQGDFNQLSEIEHISF